MTSKQQNITGLATALTKEATSAERLANEAKTQAKDSGPIFITVKEDNTDAATSDLYLRTGKRRSALEGIPIAVKDVIDTGRLRTTMGSNVFANNVPSDDAPLVKQLRQAGANVIGKTNTQEFSYGIRGDTGAFGIVTNPHDKTRIAGGSSSGSAAAVAEGIVPLAIGTDTAGSIRVPAALCGVVGFKPTYGVLDTDGIFPLSPSFDTAGLLAGSVSDVQITMNALGFADFLAEFEDHSSLSFAILTDNPITGGPGLDETAGMVLAAQLGATETSHPLVQGTKVDFMGLYNVVRCREAFLIHEQYISTVPEKYQATVLARLQEGQNVAEEQVTSALEVIEKVANHYEKIFSNTDILISSTVPIDAPFIDESPPTGSKELMSQCVIWNLLGWPALSLPYWAPGEALPKSVQLVGKPGRDVDVLRAGRFMEKILSSQTCERAFQASHFS